MITMNAKRFFFDREVVSRAMDAASRRNLSKAGAFVRRTAKGLIRFGRRASRPGNPPRSHTGALKRFLWFAFDPSSKSVVVGPAKTNQVFFQQDGTPVRGTVPSVLESGGQVRILEVLRYGRWGRADLRSRRRLAGLKTRMRTVDIKARPYMAPAWERERPKFPELWRNSVVRS